MSTNPLERSIAQEEIDLRELPVGPEFTTWLLKRVGEAGRTNVGDLAHDVTRDTDWPYLARDLWEMRRYLLEERKADDGAAEALWAAYVRWRSRTTGPVEPDLAPTPGPRTFPVFHPLPPGYHDEAAYVRWLNEPLTRFALAHEEAAR